MLRQGSTAQGMLRSICCLQKITTIYLCTVQNENNLLLSAAPLSMRLLSAAPLCVGLLSAAPLSVRLLSAAPLSVRSLSAAPLFAAPLSAPSLMVYHSLPQHPTCSKDTSPLV